MSAITKTKLLSMLRVIRPDNPEERNAIVCAKIGHSKIIKTGFDYVHCGRCGAQIGDTLGGSFDGSYHVIIGHNCDKCKENYNNLTWKDKLYCPDPFKESK